MVKYAVYKALGVSLARPVSNEAIGVTDNGTPDAAYTVITNPLDFAPGDVIVFGPSSSHLQHDGIFIGSPGGVPTIVNAYDFKNDNDNGPKNEYWGVTKTPLSWEIAGYPFYEGIRYWTAATPPPTVSSFTATPSSLPAAGGSVTLAAQVTYATTCTFSSKPPITGLPTTLACSNGSAIEDVTLPANATTNSKKYEFSVGVAGTKMISQTTSVIEAAASTSWIGSKAPLPANADPKGNSDLYFIACPAAGACEAIGDYYTKSGVLQSVIETQANGKWVPTIPPLPGNGIAGTSEFDALTCPAAGSCVAIGSYSTVTPANGEGLLIETLSGGIWTPTGAPLPSNAAYPVSASLDGISCPIEGTCVAVGSYSDASSDVSDPLIETLLNGVWTATEAPLPVDVPSGVGMPLSNIDCPITSYCVAVIDEGQEGFVFETMTAGTWVPTQGPLPENADSDPFVQIWGLACPLPGSCVAVGNFSTMDWPSSDSQGLIETLTSGVWTATEAELPSNATTDPNASLVALACPSVGSCVAVGHYGTATWDNTLFETQSDGSWIPTESTLPSSPDGLDGAISVTCSQAYSCVATGFYADARDVDHASIDTLSGGTWNEVLAPEPRNALSKIGEDETLDAVTPACSQAGYCVAVGFYQAKGNTEGLIDTLT